VDASRPGTYTGWGGAVDTVPAGTAVDVYYLHFDPVGRQRAVINNGSIHFGGTILGVIYTKGNLDATDGVLGKTGVRYPTGQKSRNYENGAEWIVLTDEMDTFIVERFHSTFPGENTRIITEAGAGMYSSYGMNNQATIWSATENEQVLLTDYGKTIINLDLRGVTNIDGLEWRRHRHGDKSNVLFGDGSVELVGNDAFFNATRPHWGSR
ncbi:MAG: H-X9-DG-CTERM domain-containing protein, partial [Planctomycetota bacterium]|jgi:prepilin-type processing-associated H-X9-DG protein